MPHSTWKKLGIQSIYTGGGVTNKSAIFWFTMPEPPVEAPDGLTTETYIFKANAIEKGKEEEGAQPYIIQVKVGFAGNDVFIQGIAEDTPDLWVKGTRTLQVSMLSLQTSIWVISLLGVIPSHII